jgi:hypothetical protein
MTPPKPRAAGQWTEAKYWAFLRSGLRRLWLRSWPPRTTALRAARRPYEGPNKRQQWEYGCKICGLFYAAKEVQVDHIQPCGNIDRDVAGFVARLFCEAEGLRCVCKPCHGGLKKNRK